MALAGLLLWVVQAGAADRLWLEAEVAPPAPVAGQQVVLTLRLLQDVDIRDLRWTVPDGAIALEEIVREQDRGARRLRVTERRYALFIDEPGVRSLPGIFVDGRVPAAAHEADPDGRKSVRVGAPPVTLHLRPAPAGLVAESVNLSESWTVRPEAHSAGVPVEWRVALTVRGQTGGRLPALQPMHAAGARLHPVGEQVSTRVENGSAIGVREQRYWFVPDGSSVPYVELVWWNPRTGVAERATVGRMPQRAAGSVESEPRPGSSAMALAVLASAAAIFGVFWFSRRGLVRARLLHAARGACRSGDARRAREGLLRWANAAGEEPVATLRDLARRSAPETRVELLALERVLFGRGSSRWDGAALARLIGSRRATLPLVRRSNGGGAVPKAGPRSA